VAHIAAEGRLGPPTVTAPPGTSFFWDWDCREYDEFFQRQQPARMQPLQDADWLDALGLGGVRGDRAPRARTTAGQGTTWASAAAERALLPGAPLVAPAVETHDAARVPQRVADATADATARRRTAYVAGKAGAVLLRQTCRCAAWTRATAPAAHGACRALQPTRAQGVGLLTCGQRRAQFVRAAVHFNPAAALRSQMHAAACR
jgi:hypothetical protein